MPSHVTRSLPLAAVCWGLASAAFAQSPPGIDCYKARAMPDRMACAESQLAFADKAMSGAYGQLVAALEGNARQHLQDDQTAWLAARAPMCDSPRTLGEIEPDTADKKRISTQECLSALNHLRAAWLKSMPTGRDYPFISSRMRSEAGSISGIRYAFSAIYAQFSRPGVDYGRLNAALLDDTKEVFDKPNRDDVVGGRDQDWSRELTTSLTFATPTLVTVVKGMNVYAGGAHPNAWVTATMVDIPSGKVVTPADLFTPGYEAVFFKMIQADLQEQFQTQPGFDDALEPAKLAPLLKEARRWQVRGDGIDVTFDAYEVGPYAAGSYLVRLPYSRIATLIRRDGPLASKVR